MGDPQPIRVYSERQVLDCARLRHGPTVTRAVLAVLADLAEQHAARREEEAPK